MSADHSVADLLPNALEMVTRSLRRLTGRARLLTLGLLPFLPVALIAGALAAVLPGEAFVVAGPVATSPRAMAFFLLVPVLLMVPGVLLFTALARTLADVPDARLWPWTPVHTRVLTRLLPLALPSMVAGAAGLPLVALALGALLLRFSPMLRTAALGDTMGPRAAWRAFQGTYLETLLAAALLAAVAGIAAEVVLYLVSTVLPPMLTTGVAAGFYGYLGALILALVLADRQEAAGDPPADG
ncbi:hypothetical protein Ga0609869_003261 [Rhodovulum iodosum]|uniref:Glycerophosphoryl diester phosphodiesterase membrane domain-containing protein n=1 Tax=Rhodovulum iodosum TaxID=68291 RepID=A0ABV3XXZ7_9RHOB|nr:hypothetical protein [Rhodovulum robiginosum]RSK34060.1 hypothetical protein EJA01_07990 [Rhodovulum robiginosum]